MHEVAIPESWATADRPARCRSRCQRPNISTTPGQPDPRAGGRQAARVRVRSRDGIVPTGTTKYEKRGIAVNVPEWQIPENCIQCNQCSLVCPHALPSVRILVKEEQTAERPRDLRRPSPPSARSSPAMQYRMQVSPLDCTGCGNCVNVCPAKEQGAGDEAAGQPGRARRRTGSSR